MSILDSYISFVNLDSRPDRLAHMIHELNRIGLRAIRQRGIPWKETDYENPKYARMYERTPGAIGCHLSQVEIMKTALGVGANAWIMEDDLVYCDDFAERVVLIDHFLQERDWDVFWLGGTFHAPAFWHRHGRSGMPPDCSAQLGKDYEPTNDKRFKRTYGAFSTYAYIVNYNSIEKILNLFDEHIHTSIGVDWLYIKLQPQLKCFAFVPGSVKQYDAVSDIGNGVTYFSGFSKLNGTEENSRYWFQKNMNDFNHDTFEWK